jgi:uncharacterized pyridoxamine 5'-phosphate oxidase family protein
MWLCDTVPLALEEMCRMHETDEEIKEFKKLVGISARTASPQLKQELGLPDHKLNGEQVLRYLQGLHTFTFAVATSSGTPQISLAKALVYRGKFYIPSTTNALRTRYLKHEPRVSLAHHKDNDITLIINGKAAVLSPETEDEQEKEEFRIVEEIHRMYSNEVPSETKKGCYIRVVPFTVCASASDPASYPTFSDRRKRSAINV